MNHQMLCMTCLAYTSQNNGVQECQVSSESGDSDMSRLKVEGQSQGQRSLALHRRLQKTAVLHECHSVCQALETDGLADKVCAPHLQRVRATQSNYCSVGAVMFSEVTSALRNVSGTLLTLETEVWRINGSGITRQGKYDYKPTCDSEFGE